MSYTHTCGKRTFVRVACFGGMMAYELPLPAPLGSQGWKVKIFDKERAEEPHVTVVRKTRRWRLALRSLGFLDKEPPPSDVPREIVAHVKGHLEELVKAWNRMYPHNPVG